MWTVFTPPTRISFPKPASWIASLLKKCGNGQPRVENPADPLGEEFAGKVQSQIACAQRFEEDGEGTLITFEEDEIWKKRLFPASHSIAMKPRSPSRAYRTNPVSLIQILGPVADANIDVDMIIQNVGEDGMTDFSFTVPRGEYQKAMDYSGVRAGAYRCQRPVLGDPKINKVSIVGVGVRFALWRSQHHVPDVGGRGSISDDLDFGNQDFRVIDENIWSWRFVCCTAPSTWISQLSWRVTCLSANNKAPRQNAGLLFCCRRGTAKCNSWLAHRAGNTSLMR